MAGYISNIIKVIAVALVATAAHAWEPTKPVTAVIGFAPGSGNELSFRGFSSLIEKANPNINFIVENRPGGDGTVGMNHFIKLPNDGHSIYIASHQGIWVTADYAHKENKRYTLDDFEYGLTLAKSPLAIIAHEKSITNTPKEFLERMKNPSGAINIAAGSGAHKLAYEYMMHYIKGNRNLIKTVPYKGPAQAGQDVAGGHLEFGIIPVAVANVLVKSGKVKIIALTSEYKLENLNNVPLMKDYIPGMNVYAAWGIIFPKGTDKEIINWYVHTFRNAINSTEGKQFMKNNLMFADVKEQTSDGFEASMMSLRKLWIPIIDEVGWNQ
jgi:tripartite-type tricarboxylate transporter receptor subunit TctC